MYAYNIAEYYVTLIYQTNPPCTPLHVCLYQLTMFLIELSHRDEDSFCWVHLPRGNARVIEILHLHENLISTSEVCVKDISQIIIHIHILNF